MINYKSSSTSVGNTPLVFVTSSSISIDDNNSLIYFFNNNSSYSNENKGKLLELLKNSTKSLDENNSYSVSHEYEQMINNNEPLSSIFSKFKEIMNDNNMKQSEKIALSNNPKINNNVILSTNFQPTNTLKSLKALFEDLENKMIKDKNVEPYAINIMKGIKTVIASGKKPDNPGPKLIKAMELIGNGIKPNASSETKNSYKNLYNFLNDIKTKINSGITKGSQTPSFQFNKNNISLLFDETNGDKVNKFGIKLSDTKNKPFFSTIFANISNAIKNSNVTPILQNFLRKRFGGRIKQPLITNIINPSTSNNTNTNSTSSNLEINTSSSNNEIYVSYFGSFSGNSVSGSYSVDSYSLSYYVETIYYNSLNLTEKSRKNLLKNSGIKDSTNSDLLKAILVFIYSYLTFYSYSISNQSNIFGINSINTNYKNLFFLFEKNYMTNSKLSESFLSQPTSMKQIMSLGIPRLWVSLLYPENT